MKTTSSWVMFALGAILSALLTITVLSQTESAAQKLPEAKKSKQISDSKQALENNTQDTSFAQEEEINRLELEAETLQQANSALQEQVTQLKESQLAKSISEKSQQADKKSLNDRLFEGVPKTHQSIIKAHEYTPKTMAELHQGYVEEEQDIAWALLKQQQISYYLSTHRLSGDLQVHNQGCKETYCEIIATDNSVNSESYQQILSEMREQAWWEFSGSSTSSNGDGQAQGVTYMITILSRRLNEKKS